MSDPKLPPQPKTAGDLERDVEALKDRVKTAEDAAALALEKALAAEKQLEEWRPLVDRAKQLMGDGSASSPAAKSFLGKIFG